MRQRTIDKATRLGFTVHQEPMDIRLEAPSGHHFIGGNHEFVYDISDGIKDRWSGRTVWQEIVEDLDPENTEPCNDNCEWWS